MKKYKSDHHCGFCVKAGKPISAANSCDLDVELVIQDKFIVIFPAMIMHYMVGTAESHGWIKPWQPPNWFVDAILEGGTITFPPTLLQEHTLPVYHVGYLTTKRQLASEYNNDVPKAYGLDATPFGLDDVVDTLGGDANFRHAEPARFGLSPAKFIERMNLLCRLTSTQYLRSLAAEKIGVAESKLDISVEQLADGRDRILLSDQTDFEVTPPPKKTVPPLSLEDFIRLSIYIDYTKTTDYKIVADDRLSDSPSILSRLQTAPASVDHADYLKLFRAFCYSTVGALKWNRDSENLKAKIDLSKTSFNILANYAKHLSFEEVKTNFLAVFAELGIKEEGIVFESNAAGWFVNIPRRLFKHLEDKGIQIERTDELKSSSIPSKGGLFVASSPAPSESSSSTSSSPAAPDSSPSLSNRKSSGE